MDRHEILDALRDVGLRLLQNGLQGDLYVVGGAAMALAYDARRTTRDIDAVFEPKREIYEAARVVGLTTWPASMMSAGRARTSGSPRGSSG